MATGDTLSKKNVALILGGTGVSGHELAPCLLKKGFRVGVMARSVTGTTFSSPLITPLRADLASEDSIFDSLQNFGPSVTHVYYFLDSNTPVNLGCLMAMRHMMNLGNKFQAVTNLLLDTAPTFCSEKIYNTMTSLAGSGSTPLNQVWLDNLFGALARSGASLRSFTLCTGGKHYGMHLGDIVWPQYSTPFQEDTHRAPGNLSYFDMEDFIKEKSMDMNFRFTVVRPSFIIGQPPVLRKSTQSLGVCLALYAHILKAQFKPLIFPGGFDNWRARIQLSSSKEIASVAAWASTSSKGGAFNAISCQSFSWCEVWNKLAQYFDMESAPPTTNIGRLSIDILGGKSYAESTWTSLVQDHDLRRDLDFEDVFNSDFFDKSFSATWDATFSSKKLVEHAYPTLFSEGDAADVLVTFFDRLAQNRLVPARKRVLNENSCIVVKKEGAGTIFSSGLKAKIHPTHRVLIVRRNN